MLLKTKKLLYLGVLLVLLTLPSAAYYKLGLFFFGGNSKIYSVSLAKIFFNISSLGLFKKAYPYSNYQLSRIHFIEGDLNTSLAYSNEELKLYPNHCRTYYIRGLTYGYMDKLNEAIQDFELFNKNCVKNSWAGHNDLAWFYFRKGEVQKMLDVIEPIAKIYPTNPWVLNTYGLALLNIKEYREAIIVLKEAKRLAHLIDEKAWGLAYPGNDPKIYKIGLVSMRDSIETNLHYAEKELYFPVK